MSRFFEKFFPSSGKDAKSAGGSILLPRGLRAEGQLSPPTPSESPEPVEPRSISGETRVTPSDCFIAPGYKLEKTVVVEATELEIQAAIVVLKARSVHFGVPQEVAAHPFSPAVGWRQAALNFIRKNQEQAAMGRPIII